MSGINLRIAARHKPKRSKRNCGCTYRHFKAASLGVSSRNAEKTDLWKFIRDPTSQFVSQFFHFRVSRNGVSPTFRNLKNYVKREYTSASYPQINFINPQQFKLNNKKNNVKIGINITDGDSKKFVQSIMNEYDFIG